MNALARRLAAPKPVSPPARVDVDELLGVAPSSTLAAPTLPQAVPVPASSGYASRRAALVAGAVVGVIAAATLAMARATGGAAPPTTTAAALRPRYAAPQRAAPPAIVLRGVEAPEAPRLHAIEAPSAPAAPRRRAAHPTLSGAVPLQPDRAATADAFGRVSSDVRRCGDGSGRTAVVTVTFASTGRVTTARVAGAPLGPVVGCVVAAVRRVTLPRFSRPLFTVSYPYPLR